MFLFWSCVRWRATRQARQLLKLAEMAENACLKPQAAGLREIARIFLNNAIGAANQQLGIDEHADASDGRRVKQ